MKLVIKVLIKAHRRFGDLHAYLRGKSHRATTEIGELLMLISCFPCFAACQVLFNIVDSLQQRELRRLRAG